MSYPGFVDDLRVWNADIARARHEYARAPFSRPIDNIAARKADQCVHRDCDKGRVEGAERCASHEAGRRRP